MAKKSNKTEHVLKLITKADDAAQNDDFFTIEEIAENGTSAVKNIILAEPEDFQDEIERGLDQLMGKEPAEGTEEKDTSAAAAVVAPPVAPEVSEMPKQHETAAVEEAPSETEAPEVKIPQPETPAEPEPPTLKAFRDQEGTGNVMLEPSEELINIAEVLAREKLSLVMDRMKVCMCKTCVNDVLALALNSLPTKYVTTDAGKQYFQRDEYKKQYETEILAALTKACVRVKASPRH